MTEALIALLVVAIVVNIFLVALINDLIVQRDKARRSLNKLLDALARKADGVNYTEGTGKL